MWLRQRNSQHFHSSFDHPSQPSIVLASALILMRGYVIKASTLSVFFRVLKKAKEHSAAPQLRGPVQWRDQGFGSEPDCRGQRVRKQAAQYGGLKPQAIKIAKGSPWFKDSNLQVWVLRCKELYDISPWLWLFLGILNGFDQIIFISWGYQHHWEEECGFSWPFWHL